MPIRLVCLVVCTLLSLASAHAEGQGNFDSGSLSSACTGNIIGMCDNHGSVVAETGSIEVRTSVSGGMSGSGDGLPNLDPSDGVSYQTAKLSKTLQHSEPADDLTVKVNVDIEWAKARLEGIIARNASPPFVQAEVWIEVHASMPGCSQCTAMGKGDDDSRTVLVRDAGGIAGEDWYHPDGPPRERAGDSATVTVTLTHDGGGEVPAGPVMVEFFLRSIVSSSWTSADTDESFTHFVGRVPTPTLV